MYQKYAITVDKNSQAGEKFYEEQIKSYIECINKNVQFAGMYEEHFVTSTVSEKEENGKLVIRISEEWTEECKAEQMPEECMSWDRKKLISEYLDSAEDVKKAVRMQYAKRATDYSCNYEFNCNELIVFDSEYMEKPLYARSDCDEHTSLPISNIIPVEEIPDKVWNTATTNILIDRCDGDMLNIDNIRNSFFLTDDEAEEDEYIPLSGEERKIFDEHSKILEQIQAELGEEFECDEAFESGIYTFAGYAYYTSGVFTKADVLKIVDCAQRLLLDSIELNSALCGTYKGKKCCGAFTILMYSDDFDAAEIFYDSDADKVMCRYYENGKTAIDKEPEETSDTVDDITEEPSDEEDTVLSGKDFTLHMTLNDSKLADLLKEKTTAADFVGKVIADDFAVEIYTDAETLQEAFEKAYSDNAELVEEINAIIGGKSIEDLEASGRITKLHPMAASHLGTSDISYRNIFISSMNFVASNCIYKDGKLIRQCN